MEGMQRLFHCSQGEVGAVILSGRISHWGSQGALSAGNATDQPEALCHSQLEMFSINMSTSLRVAFPTTSSSM